MLESQIEIEERQNKTSFSTRRCFTRKNNRTQNRLVETDRPYTTSLGRTQNSLNYRNLQMAEHELTLTFHNDMNNYIKKKIKSMTSRKNETLVVQEDVLNSTISNPQETGRWSLNKPRNVQQMNFCGLVHSGIKKKTEKVLGEPYFLNTKEKLTRLLSLKKEKEKQFSIFQDKVKSVGVEKLRIRKKKDSTFENPLHMQTLDWDNEWRKDVNKEKKRYRTRLAVKHNKKTSNMTLQW